MRRKDHARQDWGALTPVLIGIALVIGSLSPPTTIVTAGPSAEKYLGDRLNPAYFGLPVTALEITAERSERSAVFDMGDGRRAAVAPGEALFAEGEDGQWVPLSTSGRVDGSQFVFDRLAGGVEIRFDLSRPRYELTQDGRGYAVEFASGGAGVIEGDTAVRYVLADGVTLRWSVDGNRVRKEIFIDRADAAIPAFSVRGTGGENVVLTDNRLSIRKGKTELFSTVSPFLTTTGGAVIDRPVRLERTDRGYRYMYDAAGLPLPYILDPSEGPNSPGPAHQIVARARTLNR